MGAALRLIVARAGSGSGQRRRPFVVGRLGFLAVVLGNFLLEFAPFFTRVFGALMYRMRGAGPTPPGTEYRERHNPAGGENLLVRKGQLRRSARGKEWNPGSKQHWNDGNFHRVHEACVEKGAKRAPPPKSQMSRPGFSFSVATTVPGWSLTIRTPGYVAGGRVRENTTTSRPGMAPCPPCAMTTSYVLRPITAVSNSLYIAAKSMDGSMTIQSVLAIRTRDEAVQAHRHAISESSAHRLGSSSGSNEAPAAALTRRFLQQAQNPIARRSLVHLFTFAVPIGRPRAALEQEPDDAGLLLACPLRTAAGLACGLNGQMERHRPGLVRLPQIGAGVYQRPYRLPVIVFGWPGATGRRLSRPTHWDRRRQTRGIQLSQPARPGPSNWRRPRNATVPLLVGFSLGSWPRAQPGPGPPDAEMPLQPCEGPYRRDRNSDGYRQRRSRRPLVASRRPWTMSSPELACLSHGVTPRQMARL